MFISHDRPLTQAVPTFGYFSGVLVLGEGDAAAEGLVAGLEVLAGTVTVALGEGDAVAEGLAGVGVFESLAGSVAQPAENPIETIVRRSSAVRLIACIFEVLITLCLVRAGLKSGMMIARALFGSNGCSHSSFRCLSG